MPIDDTQARRVLREFVTSDLPQKTVATVQEIAIFAIEKAVQLSPIKTGWFAASWRIEREGSAITPDNAPADSAVSSDDGDVGGGDDDE